MTLEGAFLGLGGPSFPSGQVGGNTMVFFGNIYFGSFVKPTTDVGFTTLDRRLPAPTRDGLSVYVWGTGVCRHRAEGCDRRTSEIWDPTVVFPGFVYRDIWLPHYWVGPVSGDVTPYAEEPPVEGRRNTPPDVSRLSVTEVPRKRHDPTFDPNVQFVWSV